MRSPAAWLAGAFALGIFFDRVLPEFFCWIWTAAALSLSILLIRKKKHPFAQMAILATVLGLGTLVALRNFAGPPHHFLHQNFPKEKSWIEAEVVSNPVWKSVPHQLPVQQALLRVRAVGYDSTRQYSCGHLWLQHRRPAFPIRYGDQIRLPSKSIRRFVLDDENHRWDRWLWLRGADAAVDVQGEELEWLGPAQGMSRLLQALFAWREHLIWSMRYAVNARTAAVLNAFLLGDRTGLSRQVLEDFRRTGTYHILSVSGWHVTFLGGILWFLSRLVFKAEKFAVTSTVIGLVLYCFLVGAEPPIVRSTVAGVILLIGLAKGMLVAPLNSVGWAALTVLSFSPRSFWDPGFQLSFTCVISLLILSPLLMAPFEALPKFARYFIEAATVTLSAWLGSLPLVIYHMQAVSWIAVIGNLLIIPLGSLVMATGLIFWMVQSLCPGWAWAWGRALELLTHGLLLTLHELSGMKFASSELKMSFPELMVAYLLLFASVWVVRRIILFYKNHSGLDAD